MALLTLMVTAAPLHAGAEVMLYPFARAFGSPSEGELARCREAFRQFTSHLATQPVVIAPVLVAPLQPDQGPQRWRTDLAEQLGRQLAAGNLARLSTTPAEPDVAPPVMGHNQLRYAWHRAAQYAEVVKKARTSTAATLFTEVWADHGRVAAIHLFVVNSAGQIAYCRWFNSHQFGPPPALANDGWLVFATRQMLRDFARAPEAVFPRYGVG